MTPSSWTLSILGPLLIVCGALAFTGPSVDIAKASSSTCHYEYGIWNTKAKRSLVRKQVVKPRDQLRPDEIDSWGCTPCEEDQVQLTLSNGIPFRACKRVADRFFSALEQALAAGARIEKVVGYRPSLSRGPIDANYNRTEFSNHSFGAAIDINDEHNGLYHDCVVWSESCKLMRGGPWQPKHPLGLTREHPAVIEMLEHGFKWGGEMMGPQKDMMHFSKSGY